MQTAGARATGSHPPVTRHRAGRPYVPPPSLTGARLAIPPGFRPLVSRPGPTLSNSVYVGIAAIAVYGDLVKRFVSPSLALALVYLAATAVLLVMMHAPSPVRSRKSLSPLSRACSALMALYLFPLTSAFWAPALPVAIAAVYICLPLMFLVAVDYNAAAFDLRKLSAFFLVFMVPADIVGLIQLFVDPSFMISTAYTEYGGIVQRNFGSDSYNRFPSIFVSADRYSSMALLQLCCAVVYLTFGRQRESERAKLTRWQILWGVANLLLGAAAILVAGVRMRIVIGVAAALIAAAVPLMGLSRSPSGRRYRKYFLPVVVVLGVAGAYGLFHTNESGLGSSFRVLEFLGDTIEENDLQQRLDQGIVKSFVPDEVSFFGDGLATGGRGDGRPGEFGIRAMWIESGLFWTPLMLLAHAVIVASLGVAILRALLAGDAVGLFLSAVGLFSWIGGLLAGLTVVFELSTAIVLFPMIAAVRRRLLRDARVSRRRAGPVGPLRPVRA